MTQHAGTLALPGLTPRRTHAVVLACLALWAVAFALTDGVARDVVVGTVSLLPTIAVALVLRAGRLPEPRPWWLVLAGLVVLDVHNAVWLVETYALGVTSPSNPAAALALPLGYVLLLIGAVVLLRQAARQETGTVLDAAIIALSVSLLLWVLVISPALDDSVPTASRIRTMVILVVVGGIGGALARTAALLPQRRESVAYMLVAILGTLAGTLARDMTIDADEPAGARWVGLLWILAYGALVGGVLHPAAATVVPERAERGRLTTRRVWLLGIALAIGPGVLLIDAALGTAADPVFIAAVNLALVPLVVLRVSRLARLHADAERRLEHLADHDALTGLPNRRALNRHLADLLGRVADGHAPGAVVLFADLDDFKVVNDTLGHGVGDELLLAVAARLQGAVRSDPRTSDDLVARFAGDEFVVVIESDPSVAEAAAERLRAALADDVALGPHLLPAGASVGIATVPCGARSTVDEVLSTADARMYERKRERRAAAHEPDPV